MSIKRLFCASLLALAALLITCDDNDEITPRPYPRVKTNPVEEITSEGATLQGELITLSDGVIDHGFAVSQNRSFGPLLTTISLGAASQVGPFQGELHENMEEGVVYFVRAFAKSKSHEVVGDIVEFRSLGSKAPQLISIAPVTGTWGDKIVLKGKHFTNQEAKITVKFGNVNATVHEANADSIICSVPPDLHHAPADVSVSVFGNVSKLTEVFQLTKPVINSIDPAKAYMGTPVVIKGNFFRTPMSEVMFGNVAASVTKTTPTELQCIVPANTGFGTVIVKVIAGTGNLFAETTFEIPEPKVFDFSPKTGIYRNTVTITGESFNPESTNTVVMFGESQAPIVSITSTQIEVTVPDFLESPESDVTVITEGLEMTFDSPFTLLPLEITSVQPTEKLLIDQTNITINGKNFGYDGNQVKLGDILMSTLSQDPSQVVLQPYDGMFNMHELDLTLTASGRSVTKDNVYYVEWINPTNTNPNEFAGFNIGIEINGDLYVFANESGSVSTFKFNQANSTWEYITNNAPPSTNDQFKFSMNGKGYVGGGTDVVEASFTLHEFDQSTNQWTQLNDVPFESLSSVGFSLGNSGYVATSARELWKYNVASDSWTQLNNISTDLLPHKGFMHNNAFYGLTEYNYLVKYNEATDTWEKGVQFPGAFHQFLFELNGRIFFGYQDWWSNNKTQVISLNLNALDEKRVTLPMTYVQHSLSTNDKAFLFAPGNWGQPIYWVEYEPYEE
jgi:hypothetical protein